MERLSPKCDKGLLYTSQRDRAQNGPLNWPHILLQQFVYAVENEDGERKAKVGHGYVEGELHLGIVGERVLATWAAVATGGGGSRGESRRGSWIPVRNSDLCTGPAPFPSLYCWVSGDAGFQGQRSELFQEDDPMLA